MSKKILEIEMVPSSMWGYNLRSILTTDKWDELRRFVYSRAKHKCEICGAKGRMEAHEIWSYDMKTSIQKLEDLVCLCNKCHMAKHFGRSQMIGKGDQCIKHMQKINLWSYAEVMANIDQRTKEWNEREKYDWQLDISKLMDIFPPD